MMVPEGEKEFGRMNDSRSSTLPGSRVSSKSSIFFPRPPPERGVVSLLLKFGVFWPFCAFLFFILGGMLECVLVQSWKGKAEENSNDNF